MGYCRTVDGARECIRCGETKPIGEFYTYQYVTKQGKRSTRHESRCKSCARERRNERYANPSMGAMDRATSQAWKDQNRDALKAYAKARQADPAYRALKAKAQRHRKARMRAGTSHHDPEIAAIYKAAMDLEKKLAECVECDDPLEMKIHVDHIVPLKLGGKHVASNLQLLSARENMKKGAKPHFAMTGAADA